MATFVNTNFASLQAQSQLAKTNFGLTQAMERLSSGKRINSAKDDASGLAIASRFTSQIRGYNQGVRNANDAISMSQTAEGALDEMSTNIQRIRELAVQSNNATNTDSDRSALNAEVAVLKAEISRIASTAEFNGKKMFGASAGTHTFQVGAGTGGGDRIDVTFKNMSSDTAMTNVTGGTVGTQTGAQSMIALADTFLATINSERANLGAIQNRFESVVRSSQNTVNNLSDARSRIEDADFAAESANLAKYQILQQAGLSILGQANQMPQSALSLLR